MATFQTIRSAIQTKLESMTGDGQPLAFVYNHHKLGVAGFPAATFEPSAVSSEIRTTSENYRTYGFDIVIQQEAENIDRQTALDSLIPITDLIIDAFDQDYTLSGACDLIEAVPAEFGEILSENGLILYATIQLKCGVLKSIL